MARQYHRQSGSPGRYKTISFYRSYHGATMGALTQTGWPQLRAPYEPFLTGGLHVHPPIPGACRFCAGSCTLGCLAQLRDVIEHEAPRTISAIIVEPVMLTAGVHALSRRVPAGAPGALRRDRCPAHLRRDRHRLRAARLVVRGRAGRRLAGHPLRRQRALRAATRRSRPFCSPRRSAGVLGRGRRGTPVPGRPHLRGNPVSAACGLAVIRYFEEHGVLENVRRARLRARGPAARDRGPLPDRRRRARVAASSTASTSSIRPRAGRCLPTSQSGPRCSVRPRRARPARPSVAAQRDLRAAAGRDGGRGDRDRGHLRGERGRGQRASGVGRRDQARRRLRPVSAAACSSRRGVRLRSRRRSAST